MNALLAASIVFTVLGFLAVNLTFGWGLWPWLIASATTLPTAAATALGLAIWLAFVAVTHALLNKDRKQ